MTINVKTVLKILGAIAVFNLIVFSLAKDTMWVIGASINLIIIGYLYDTIDEKEDK